MALAASDLCGLIIRPIQKREGMDLMKLRYVIIIIIINMDFLSRREIASALVPNEAVDVGSRDAALFGSVQM